MYIYMWSYTHILPFKGNTDLIAVVIKISYLLFLWDKKKIIPLGLVILGYKSILPVT